MNDQYLVMIRYTMDDYPVRIFQTREEAEELAREIVEARQAPEWFLRFWKAESTFDHVVIVQFHGGVPARMWSMGPTIMENRDHDGTGGLAD